MQDKAPVPQEGPMFEVSMTHAAQLVAFRAELVEGGFTVEEAAHLSSIALSVILSEDRALAVLRDGEAVVA